MEVNSTVVWRIKDVRIAAMMAAETMSVNTNQGIAADITKLRRDVLKQAIASLAGFIGSVNYSDSFHVAAAAQRNADMAAVVSVDDALASDVAAAGGSDAPMARSSTDNPMFDSEGMSEAVTHANQITCKFGVDIIGINIISANPVDPQLTASLATGAVGKELFSHGWLFSALKQISWYFFSSMSHSIRGSSPSRDCGTGTCQGNEDRGGSVCYQDEDRCRFAGHGDACGSSRRRRSRNVTGRGFEKGRDSSRGRFQTGGRTSGEIESCCISGTNENISHGYQRI